MNYEKIELAIGTIIVLLVVIVLCLVKIRDLNHEKEVYNWKYFTAKTLLDDPVTRDIVCTKWRKK